MPASAGWHYNAPRRRVMSNAAARTHKESRIADQPATGGNLAKKLSRVHDHHCMCVCRHRFTDLHAAGANRADAAYVARSPIAIARTAAGIRMKLPTQRATHRCRPRARFDIHIDIERGDRAAGSKLSASRIALRWWRPCRRRHHFLFLLLGSRRWDHRRRDLDLLCQPNLTGLTIPHLALPDRT